MTFATGVMYAASWQWHVAAWFGVLAFLFAGWLGALLVTALVRPGRGDPLNRSLFSAAHAVVALLVVNLGLRGLEWIWPGFGPGPQHWLFDWVPAPVASGIGLPQVVHPYDTLLVINFMGAGIAAAVMVLAALLDPPTGREPLINRPVGGGVAASVFLVLVGMALPYVFYRAYGPDTDVWWLLDLVGIAPLVSLLLAARLQAFVPPKLDPTEQAEELADAHTPPDIVAAWAAAGLVDPDAPALLDFEPDEARGGEATDRAKAAWDAAGGPGLPPGALDTLLGEAHLVGTTSLVGDLPEQTEHWITTALLADLVGVRGLRVLVITDSPMQRARQLENALERARTWQPGHLAVGAEALREALARHRLPAAVFVTLADLSQRLIRLAANEGRLWTAGLSLLVVHRPDVGRPIAASHRAFTLRRWHLATGALACPPVVAFAPDTTAVLAHLEQLFPERTPKRCPLRARNAGRILVLRAKAEDEALSDPWGARAARAITDLGETVSVVDPSGTWEDTSIVEPGVRLSSQITYPKRASVMELSVHSLAEAFRLARHRLDGPNAQPHHSLWNVRATPVTRFLMVPGRLETLFARKDLPTPAPVVGHHNRFLRLAHLYAALHEAEADERRLRRAFGDDVVDFVLRQAERTDVHIATRVGNEVMRSPVVRAPAGKGWVDPRVDTVTRDAVEIIDDVSGQVLLTVDERLAATRYYPKRVFSVGSRRFRVPLHALDSKRRQVRVRPAGPRDLLTLPLLRFQIEPRRVVTEKVTRRQGKLTVSTLTIDALVKEEVLASWVPGQDQEERFEPVNTSYDGQVRLIFPAGAQEGPGLFHLCCTLDDLLPAHLRIASEDAEVVPIPAGFVPGEGAGIAVIDRHVGGMGLARTLHDAVVIELLRWARAILYECTCLEGCVRCTPELALRAGPAKQAVLELLPS